MGTKIMEKSGNFVSPEKWEPWLFEVGCITFTISIDSIVMSAEKYNF